jgi:hypothetical protein
VLGTNPVSRDRLRDVLDLLRAQVLEIDCDLGLDLVVDIACDADAAGLGYCLQPGGDINPVSVDVVALDDYVADVDAHAVSDAMVFWDISVAQAHGSLHIDGEAHGIHDTAELHQRAVAHELDDPPVVLSGLGLDKLSSNCLERRERPGLVGSHEAAVTDNIGSEDGGQPALYALFAHGKPLAGEIAV